MSPRIGICNRGLVHSRKVTRQSRMISINLKSEVMLSRSNLPAFIQNHRTFWTHPCQDFSYDFYPFCSPPEFQTHCFLPVAQLLLQPQTVRLMSETYRVAVDTARFNQAILNMFSISVKFVRRRGSPHHSKEILLRSDYGRSEQSNDAQSISVK